MEKRQVRLEIDAHMLIFPGTGSDYLARIWFGTMEFSGIGKTPEEALQRALADGARRGFAPRIVEERAVKSDPAVAAVVAALADKKGAK